MFQTKITEMNEISEEIDGWFYRFWYVSHGQMPGTIVWRCRTPSFDDLDQEVLGIDGEFHPFLDYDCDCDQVFSDNAAAKKTVECILKDKHVATELD